MWCEGREGGEAIKGGWYGQVHSAVHLHHLIRGVFIKKIDFYTLKKIAQLRTFLSEWLIDKAEEHC